MSDPRFSRLTTDPRFRRPKQKQLKVQLDDRFKAVLESEEFGGAGAGAGPTSKRNGTDKYGRPISSTHEADQLKKFYRLASPSGEEAEKPRVDYSRGEGLLESSGDEDESGSEQGSSDEDEVEVGGKRRVRLPGIEDEESSDEDDTEDEDRDEEGGLNINLSEDDEPILPSASIVKKTKGKGKSRQTEESAFPDEEEEEPLIDPTTRIAIVNLDWDNLHSRDLYKIFSSFLAAANSTSKRGSSSSKREPVQGELLSVKIYPSEFGRERMEREEREGPAREIFEGLDAQTRRETKSKNRKEMGRKRKITRREVEEEEELDQDDLGVDEEIEEDVEEDDLDGEQDSDDEALGPEDDESGDDVGEYSEGEDDNASEESDDSDAGSLASSSGEVNQDLLRAYQLERLRYYYAIATFSHPSAAGYIMKECNGAEFERTANVLDLSFVPEEMEFDEDYRDESTEDPKSYKGIDFVTDALRHSKVKLTWDQDDPSRQKLLRRPFTKQEIDEEDFRAYLAASSDEETSEEDLDGAMNGLTAKEKKARRKAKTEELRQKLLGGGDGTEDVWGKHADLGNSDEEAPQDMEITFKSALTSSSKALDDDDNLTTLERYQRRMKEKKERKKEKKELKAGSRVAVEGEEAGKTAVAEADDFFGDSEDEAMEQLSAPSIAEKPIVKSAIEIPDETRHFSMQDILKAEKKEGQKKSRRRPKKSKYDDEREAELGDAGFALNVKDDRFKAIHEEPAFAIDPSDPHYKKTKAMTELLNERTRRRQQAGNEAQPEVSRTTKQREQVATSADSMADLVASVKRKFEGEEKPAGKSKSRHPKRGKK